MSAAQVRAYAAKAEEFAEAAASDLAGDRNVAATSLAIHAGISSADAVCGARLGQRAAGDDHDQVLILLRQAGPDGAEVERELRRSVRPPGSGKRKPTDSPIRPQTSGSGLSSEKTMSYVRRGSASPPMAITWELAHPLPGDLYASFAAAVG